jgi:hypothetical protein
MTEESLGLVTLVARSAGHEGAFGGRATPYKLKS